jgi:hypothetical protein
VLTEGFFIYLCQGFTKVYGKIPLCHIKIQNNTRTTNANIVKSIEVKPEIPPKSGEILNTAEVKCYSIDTA